MKKLQLFGLLLLAVFMLFSAVGCAPAEEPPAETGEPEVVLDADEVLMQAALDYFEQVAAGNKNITDFKEIKAMLDVDPESVLIIDIRSAEDFEAGHITGSVNADKGEVAELMSRIPRDKPVFIACYSGQTAGFTTAYLRMAGFDNVTSMLYGIKLGWVERGSFTLDAAGKSHLNELPEVSAPASEEEEIIWARAKEYGAAIAAGSVGFIALDAQEALYAQMQADPTSVLFYDIRAATGGDDDFDKYHIEHAVNVAWGQFGTLLTDLPTDIPVVVACYSGQTAAQTLGVLRMLGLDNAQSLHFGVRDGWVKQNNLPVVTP
ncbi:MAG: rhodanese-like domain-containing protein [Bacillota bacterium]